MKKIVVVDDQPILGNIYRAKFSAEGFQVDVATDGEAALELIQRVAPDLVLLDVMLPKIDGLEVLRRLRENRSFSTIPIIVFSASARPGIAEEAWAAGSTMVLSKTSTSPKQITELVRKTLAGISDQITEPNSFPVKSNNSETGPAVVLCEQQPEARALVSLLLEQKGFRVRAMDAKSAIIEFIRRNRPQIFD